VWPGSRQFGGNHSSLESGRGLPASRVAAPRAGVAVDGDDDADIAAYNWLFLESSGVAAVASRPACEAVFWRGVLTKSALRGPEFLFRAARDNFRFRQMLPPLKG